MFPLVVRVINENIMILISQDATGYGADLGEGFAVEGRVLLIPNSNTGKC